MLKPTNTTSDLSPETQELMLLSRQTMGENFRQLNTSIQGLPVSEIPIRMKRYGLNSIVSKHQQQWPLKLLKTFNSPFNYLLVFLGILSFVSGNSISALMITIMVFLSVFLKFFQEERSNKATEKLQALVTNKVSVLRRASDSVETGDYEEVPLQTIVSGDIIRIGVGDLIPADVRIVEGKDLQVNQSALSGESLPVKKNPDGGESNDNSVIDRPNLCFMGTSVSSGMAKALVLKTGVNTYFGNLASKITAQEEPTSFDTGLTNLSWLLIRFILVMTGVIFIINGFTKGDWLNSLLFSLSVGVGLTPEMLPMIVTTNLSRGALMMARKKVIVKKLASIQNLGAMTILCTDKTGTLTQNKVILYKHLDVDGNESTEVLRYAYLNSYFQSGHRNILDEAILSHAEIDKLGLDKTLAKKDEIPFDFERRRLSVVLKNPDASNWLICKGAVEEIHSVCVSFMEQGKITPLTSDRLNILQQNVTRLNEDGFRVIAIATKVLEESKASYPATDEHGLCLQGYIAFLDPPKESTTEAIRELNSLGIELKILTGDNEPITRKICNLVGLPIKGALAGKDIDSLSDEALGVRAEATTLFSKLTPMHKQRLVQVLQQKNHVVGFLGDGINDAPALRAADVGVSVDNAADIAKESADIILLEQNLLVLKEGVLEGRKVFGNIIKYIRMSTSSNFGNVLSMVGASFLLPFLPLMPIQILTQNLLYDFSQMAIPFDTVDKELLAQPRRWEIPKIQNFMLAIGPVSSIFDYVLFALMWFVFKANSPLQQQVFQTGWFIEGLLTQTLIVHLIRTRKLPFIESWAAPQLLFLTVLIMIIGVFLPYSPLAPYFGFVPLPSSYFVWLVGILISYSALTQLVKQWFIQRYGYE